MEERGHPTSTLPVSLRTREVRPIVGIKEDSNDRSLAVGKEILASECVMKRSNCTPI